MNDLVRIPYHVYNFQCIFNVQFGNNLREFDLNLPYLVIRSVIVVEYENRAELYDTQLKEIIGIDPVGKSTTE